MPDAQLSAKTCTLCCEDCSSRPRIKDPQGRYFCKACVDRRAAAEKGRAAAPPPPPVAEDEALPASFWNDVPSLASSSPCPGCGAPMVQGAVVCLSCGHNRQSGRGSRVKVRKAPRERSGPGIKLAITPGMLAIGLLVVFGAAFPFAVGSEAGAISYYIAAHLLVAVATITTIVAAFKDGHKGWGITGILSFVVPCLSLGMLYYALCVREGGYAKVLMAVGLTIGVVSVIGLAVAGVDLSQFRPGG